MNDHRVRAVFFDFGGVIARLDRNLLAEFETGHGLPEGSFIKAMYTIPEWRAVEVGKGSEDAWMEAAKRKLDEIAGRELPAITEERMTMWQNLDRDVIDLAGQLKGRYKVGVLSNATDRLEAFL